jgi:nucleoside-diphosphate-sugar epimerase
VRTLIVGCGYVGLRVGQRLSERGETVVGTTRSTDRFGTLERHGIHPIVADVLKPETLAGVPHVERVLYCVGFDRSAGIAMRTVYVDGLRNFLDHLGLQSAHVVYASSTGVYGQTDGAWVDEDSPTIALHDAGKVAVAAEECARGLCPGVIVLRYSGHYGPGRIPHRERLALGEPIAGDPDKYLNLIHIDDAVAATIAALDRGTPGRCYLVSDDRPVTRGEYANLVATCLQAPAPRFAAPAAETPASRREESNKRVSNLRMKEELDVVLSFPDITSGVPAALNARDT